MTHTISMAVLTLLTTASLTGQGPRAIDSLLTPIHSLGADYGTLAAGPHFKVRFDGGFAYYAALGSAYPENLPFGWTTESVRVGDTELAVGPCAERRAADFRFEYRFRDVVEAYDVRAGGVEQTFVIEVPPAQRGELVVVGRVLGPLDSEVADAKHAALEFRGPNGEVLIEYGAATAVDADGRAFPMTSEFDGECIRLRLSARDVEAAAFPLVVDPLIGNDPIREAGTTSVAVTDSIDSNIHGICLYTRISSASDHDVFGVLVRPGMVIASLAFADISTSWSSEQCAAGVIDGHKYVVVAAERRQGFSTHLETYVHYARDTGFRTGVSAVQTAVNGEHYRNPDVGGNRHTGAAIVVYDHTQLGSTTIRGHLVDWQGVVTPLANQIAAPSIHNHERDPSVTPFDWSGVWVVCWAGSHVQSSDIYARRIWGVSSQDAQVHVVEPASSSVYRNPRIAGVSGRFLLTFDRTPLSIGIASVRARRLDWFNSSGPTLRHLRTISSGATYTNGELACDPETKSHWVAVYERSTVGVIGSEVQAVRMGYTGAIVDSLSIHPSVGDAPFAPSVCMGEHAGRAAYRVLYATANTTANSVFGESWDYPIGAYVHTDYGVPCGHADAELFSPTIAGSEFWESRLIVHHDQPATMLFSRFSNSIALDLIGMTGCSLYVEPTATLSFPGSSAQGDFVVQLPLPDSPLFDVPFYTQWIYIGIGKNALGVVANSGTAHQPF